MFIFIGCDLDKDSSLALDLLWTDVCPSELDAELSTTESSGFGINDARGPNIKVCYFSFSSSRSIILLFCL